MSLMNICIVLTARGNYAKMKSVLSGINNSPSIQLQVIVGGSLVLDKYGKIMETAVVDEIPVDGIVHFLIEGETPVTMAKSAGLALSEFATQFQRLNPDAVIVIADRFESLAIAMAASYMNIPVVHVEGGEISGSIDESIRHAITKLAHLHFPASKSAADRIIKMGERKDSVFAVGSTSLDILNDTDLLRLEDAENYQLLHGVGKRQGIRANEFLIVIQHPVTTEYEQNYRHVRETVEAVHEMSLPTLWIWPNMDAGSDGVSKAIRDYREKLDPAHVYFFKSLPIEIYGMFLKHAACIVGNSSSGIREAAFLGTPCVNIGSRQDGRDRGRNTRDVGYCKREIVEATNQQITAGRFTPDYLYGDGNAAGKIVRILEGYEFTKQKQNSY